MSLAALFLSALALAVNPVATTGSAESITTGSAALTGTVNPGGEATTYHFEYGTTDAYGLVTPDQNLPAGTDPADVRATVSNLTSNTTYHFRVVATNPSGSHAGADKTFRTATPASPPSVSSRAASGVSATGAAVAASVNPRGLATTVRFEYGTSTAYGAATAEQAIGAGTSSVTVRAAISGLRPNTRYSYRAVATSAAGVRRGGNRTFTTGKAPTGIAVTPSTVRPIWSSSVSFRGTVTGSGATPVALEKQDFPFSGPWAQVATATSSSKGAFTLNSPALFATTRLRVVTRTAVVVVSGVTTANVAVKVGLKTKRVSGRRMRLTGATWPDVPAGRASLQRQSRSGRWGPVARTKLSPLPGGRSRYSFVVSRRSRALSYRVVVVPNDGGAHVSGHSRVISVPSRR
jgi:hypothetical protein